MNNSEYLRPGRQNQTGGQRIALRIDEFNVFSLSHWYWGLNPQGKAD